MNLSQSLLFVRKPPRYPLVMLSLATIANTTVTVTPCSTRAAPQKPGPEVPKVLMDE